MATNDLRTQEMNDLKEQSFKDWLSRPETGALTAMIPNDGKELLQVLLKSAYTAGFAAGQAAVMLEVLKEVMSQEKRP